MKSATADDLLSNKDIVFALGLAVDPATWPDAEEEGEKVTLLAAEQPARIGRILVREVHTHLVNAKIGYLYREKMSTRDKVKLAKASKAGSKLRFYSELDFVIDVNHEAWLTLTDEQRVALIDHELHHFGIGDDGKYILVPHDLEEFGAIVRRWGLWMPDVKEFGRALADQGDLFKQVEMDNTKVSVSGNGKTVETTMRGMGEAVERVTGKKRQ